jgi:hypothetical protein
MAYSDILFLSMIALLALEYARRRRRFRRLTERQWPGHGIDVSGVSQRVERLRRDYIAGLPSRPSGPGVRQDMLASARQTIARLSYFRRRDVHDTVHADHEEAHAA